MKKAGSTSKNVATDTDKVRQLVNQSKTKWAEISECILTNSELVIKCSELTQNLIKAQDEIISNQQKYMQMSEDCNEKKERIKNLKKRIADLQFVQSENHDMISFEFNLENSTVEDQNELNAAEAENHDMIAFDGDGNGENGTAKDKNEAAVSSAIEKPVKESHFNWTPLD